MKKTIMKYDIFNKLELNDDFIKNIKILYVFRDFYKDESNVFFGTNENKIYTFGNNSCGVLGFGHKNEVKHLTINEDLSNKQIIDFKNSNSHVSARTADGKVYSWGWNESGLLGNGKYDGKMYKPEVNQYLRDKHIIDVCCGYNHTLVLTIDGEVYAWGKNSSGQIGNQNYDNVFIPHHVNGFNGEKVKAISCGERHSMALTENGHVFSWGSNICGQLGLEKFKDKSINVPKLVKISVIFEKISCGRAHSLLLSNDGYIHLFGSNELGQLGDENIKEQSEFPLKLKNLTEFIEVASHFGENISIALSKRGVVIIWGKCGEHVVKTPSETQFKSFNEVFAHYFQITYNTVFFENKHGENAENRRYSDDFNDESAIQTIFSFPDSNPNQVKHDKTKINLPAKYKNEFKELELVGSGNFGRVYKAFNLFDEQNYAVKKILLSEFSDEIKKKSIDELKLMAKLQSDHVVQYKSSWIENNEILYIQMELCFTTLRDILLKKRNEFQRKEFQPMSRLEYYISSELFREILEAVNFLHKLNIIHRDLKPTNILITNGTNGRFVKLADFGLAVVHQFDEQTHTQGLGTIKYIAPEVLNGKNYDTMADIYSLGSVAQEIFDIDINSSSSISINDQLLNKKYETIYKIILKMMKPMKNFRPSCIKILRNKSFWALNSSQLTKGKDYNKISREIKTIESFHMCFIQTKTRFYENSLENYSLFEKRVNHLYWRGKKTLSIWMQFNAVKIYTLVTVMILSYYFY